MVRDGGIFIGERKFSDGDEIHPDGSFGYFRLEGGVLVRYSGSGRAQYRFSLMGDGEYRAGPSFAHRVKDPEEERDPIKRVLRAAGLPVSILRRIEDGEMDVELRGRPERSGAYMCDLVITDGVSNNPGWRDQKITQVGCALVMRAENPGCGLVRRLREVLVGPSCDPELLEKALQVAEGHKFSGRTSGWNFKDANFIHV